MLSRRDFLKLSGAGMLSLYAASRGKFAQRVFASPFQAELLILFQFLNFRLPF